MGVKETIDAILEGGYELPTPIHEYGFCSPKDVRFGADVREACERNLCGAYGKCWVCPPGVGEWEELRDHFMTYSSCFVFTTKHDLEDSYDFEGMGEGRKKHNRLEEALLKLFREQNAKFEMLGVGGCNRCAKCTYPEAPCRFPDAVVKSMEACGIDVVTLSKTLGIHYINGADTVTYFSAIFW